MREGKLNQREMDTLLRARRILNAWADWHEGSREGFDEEAAYSQACTAAGSIADFLFDTRGE